MQRRVPVAHLEVRVRGYLALLLVSAVTVAAGAEQAAPPTAAVLAARVEAHYATVKDFTAEFRLTQKAPLSLKPTEERGDVKVMKASGVVLTAQVRTDPADGRAR